MLGGDGGSRKNRKKNKKRSGSESTPKEPRKEPSEEVKKKAMSMYKEYLNVLDVNETKLCVEELNAPEYVSVPCGALKLDRCSFAGTMAM